MFGYIGHASHTALCGLPCNALYVIARSCLQRRGNLPEGTHCKSDGAMFLPIGKSDVR